jgi:hypothetical protein
MAIRTHKEVRSVSFSRLPLSTPEANRIPGHSPCSRMASRELPQPRGHWQHTRAEHRDRGGRRFQYSTYRRYYSALRLRTKHGDKGKVKADYNTTAIAKWLQRAQEWNLGKSDVGIDLLCKPARQVPRDVFPYVISGFRACNPAAADALISALKK